MSTDRRTEPVDVHEALSELCAQLGLNESHVQRMEITPTRVVVHVYRGQDGLGKGTKYVNKGLPGQLATAAVEVIEFEIRS